MTLWIALTLLTSIAAVLAAVPFIRRLDLPQTATDRAVAVAAEQIRSLEAELDQGMIGAEEAALARKEIERRIVVAAKSGEPQLSLTSERGRLLAVAIVVGWIALGSTILYTFVGRPDLPSAPFSGERSLAQTNRPAAETSSATAQSQIGSVDQMIAGLAARLEANPDDAEGWKMLGWSYFNTENYAESVKAYARAVALDATDADVFSAYGEAQVRAGGGLVTDEAIKAFDAALALNPDDPRARFFKGLRLQQDGDAPAALSLWIDILRTAPAGAEWAPGLRQRVEELAAATNTQLPPDLPATSPPSGGAQASVASQNPGPTAQDVAAAQQMSPQDRQAMIEGMVERLAARLQDNPNDADGWIRLMRSRMVLGQPEKAREALAQARSALASDAPTLAAVEGAAKDLGVE